MALDKARLLNEAETEKERAETENERSDALYQISNQLAGAHHTDEMLNLIVNEATRLLGAYGAVIRLLEGDILVASVATESAATFLASMKTPLKVGEGMAGHVMATKKPLSGENGAHMLSPESRLLFEEQGIDLKASVMVPLLADDRPLGVLAVVEKRIRRFTEDEVSLSTAFADQASLALEKARLLNEAQREKERSDALYQVSNKLAGIHDTHEVLDLIVNEATRLLGASGAYTRLFEGNVLMTSVAKEFVAEFVAKVA